MDTRRNVIDIFKRISSRMRTTKRDAVIKLAKTKKDVSQVMKCENENDLRVSCFVAKPKLFTISNKNNTSQT